jgi:guanine deaminase
MRIRCRVLTPTSPESWSYADDVVLTLDGGRVAAVAPFDGGPVDEDLRDGVLTPGFVDGHVHFPQTRIVGAATGPLLDWLARSTFPEEARFADVGHAQAIARVFVRSLASSGTTLALAYSSVHAAACDALFAESDRVGLRLIAGPVLMDEHSPDELLVPADRAIPAIEALAERWHGRDGRLEVAVVPRFALSCSRDLMARAGRLAADRGLIATTHLAENPIECDVAVSRFKARDYLSIYEDAGLVRPGAVFAHCIHLSDDAWDRLRDAGAVVAHCPDSNAFLGSGHLPTAAVVARDLPVTLGTDVAAGRTFRVPHIASAAYDNALAVGAPISPARVFWWATAGGAAALGHPDVGQVAPGFDADLVLHDVPPWAESGDAVLAAILFDHDAPRPRRTWVHGRVVYERVGPCDAPWAR